MSLTLARKHRVLSLIKEAGPGDLPQTNLSGQDVSDYAKTRAARPAAPNFTPMAPTRTSSTPPPARAKLGPQMAARMGDPNGPGNLPQTSYRPAPNFTPMAPTRTPSGFADKQIGAGAKPSATSDKLRAGQGYGYLARKWGGGITAAQVREHMKGKMLHAGKDYARPDAATLASIGKLKGMQSKFTRGAKNTAPSAARTMQANTLSTPGPQFSTEGMNRMPGAEVRSPNSWRTPVRSTQRASAVPPWI